MIYLDHASTSRLYPEVASYIQNNLIRDFANPASAHSLGLKQEHLLKDSLEQLAKDLNCKVHELIVTSGATESINTAIQSTVKKLHRSGRRIISTAGDHEATLNCVKTLKQEGFQTVEANLTSKGTVDLDHMAELMNDETILINVICVSNETGAINDIASIAALRDKLAPKALLHVDYVQAWTRIPLDLQRSGVNFASFSGHKIHAPKGIGLLYVRDKTPFVPLIVGGGQQSKRRSGTENPLLLGALALASKIGCERMDADSAKVRSLNDQMRRELAELPIFINSPDDGVPHILNLSFPPARGETMLHILAHQEIYLSTTSACSTAQNAKSHVLTAMGINGQRLDGTLRVSLAAENNETEITEAAGAIKQAYEQLALIGGKR